MSPTDCGYARQNDVLRSLHADRMARLRPKEQSVKIPEIDEEISVRISEKVGAEIGSMLWLPGAEALAFWTCHWLQSRGEDIIGAGTPAPQIVELGAGVGFTGLYLSKWLENCHGAALASEPPLPVVLTDQAKVLPYLQRNVELNQSNQSGCGSHRARVQVCELDWAKAASEDEPAVDGPSAGLSDLSSNLPKPQQPLAHPRRSYPLYERREKITDAGAQSLYPREHGCARMLQAMESGRF